MNQHPPPTRRNRTGPKEATFRAGNVNTPNDQGINTFILTPKIKIGQAGVCELINQAQRRALAAPPGDIRHARILGSLRRLARDLSYDEVGYEP